MIRDIYHRVNQRAGQIAHGRITQKIFFLHMAKCGGTSLLNAIKRGYASMSAKEDETLVHLDPFAIYEAAQQRQIDPITYSKLLLHYFLSSSANRFVYGHFGIDEQLLADFKDQFAFITMLRDPIEKWKSAYFFMRYHDKHYFKIEKGIEAYLESPQSHWQGREYVARLIGGSMEAATCTEEEITCAKKILDQFALVGCLEQMDRFITDFAAQFGVRLVMERRRQNPVPKEKQAEMLTPEILARVQAICKPNMALYEHACKKLHRNRQE